MAEREGFEPSHRFTQSNGLANRPLIASWVPLQVYINKAVHFTPFTTAAFSILEYLATRNITDELIQAS